MTFIRLFICKTCGTQAENESFLESAFISSCPDCGVSELLDVEMEGCESDHFSYEDVPLPAAAA